MKKIAFYLFATFLIMVGCTDRDDELNGINIRIKNNNSFAYDTVAVSGTDELYENVAAGESSEYLVYEQAYQFASITITAGEQSYDLQIIDFVGETPLRLGFYTYELTAEEGGTIALKFIVE